jgi:hypothetical protein
MACFLVTMTHPNSEGLIGELTILPGNPMLGAVVNDPDCVATYRAERQTTSTSD